MRFFGYLVYPGGFEPLASGVGVLRSIQLSYEYIHYLYYRLYLSIYDGASKVNIISPATIKTTPAIFLFVIFSFNINADNIVTIMNPIDSNGGPYL